MVEIERCSHERGFISPDQFGQIEEDNVAEMMGGIEKDIMEREEVSTETETNKNTDSNIFIPGEGVLLNDGEDVREINRSGAKLEHVIKLEDNVDSTALVRKAVEREAVRDS